MVHPVCHAQLASLSSPATEGSCRVDACGDVPLLKRLPAYV